MTPEKIPRSSAAGLFIKIIGEVRVKEGLFFRSGSIHECAAHSKIAHVRSIINVKIKKNKRLFGCSYFHFPMRDRQDVYLLSDKNSKKWFKNVVNCIGAKNFSAPFLIHCTSGKDRTGVLVAGILAICGLEGSQIIEEYLLSEGAGHPGYIQNIISDIGALNSYVGKQTGNKIKTMLLL